jgi:hypothetical protein
MPNRSARFLRFSSSSSTTVVVAKGDSADVSLEAEVAAATVVAMDFVDVSFALAEASVCWEMGMGLEAGLARGLEASYKEYMRYQNI